MDPYRRVEDFDRSRSKLNGQKEVADMVKMKGTIKTEQSLAKPTGTNVLAMKIDRLLLN